jgi:hypothetical protein
MPIYSSVSPKVWFMIAFVALQVICLPADPEPRSLLADHEYRGLHGVVLWLIGKLIASPIIDFNP